MAIRGAPRLGMERRITGLGGVAVRRVRAEPLDAPTPTPAAVGTTRRSATANSAASNSNCPRVASARFRRFDSIRSAPSVWLSETPDRRRAVAVARVVRPADGVRGSARRRTSASSPRCSTKGRSPSPVGARCSTTEHVDALAHAAASAPAICRNGSSASTDDILGPWSTGSRERSCTTADGSPTSAASAPARCRRCGRCSRRWPSPIR